MRKFLAVFAILMSVAAGNAVAQEYNADRPGRDYRSFALSAADYRLCERACDTDDSCRAYTYANPGVAGSTAMCFLKSAVPPRVANPCCISGIKDATPPPPPEEDADEARCTTYANEAVRASRANTAEGCGFTGLRWTSNRNEHFNWCMDNPESASRTESRARNAELTSCRASSEEEDTVEACRNYSNAAIRAFNESERLECGFSGPRWTGSRRAHTDWCLSATPDQRAAEQRGRDRDLQRCRASTGGVDEPPPGDRFACREFVQQSVEQSLQNRALRCGFDGARWSSDRNIHREFCRTRPRDSQRREIAKRGELLDICESNPAKTQICRQYSNQAVVQSKRNVARRCNFAGPDWATSYEPHFAWCMGSGRSARASKILAREVALLRCR